MTPRSGDIAKAREDLKNTLAAAKAKRDKVFEDTEKLREAADAELWKTVGAQLDGAYHGARTDAVEVLGVTRDYILKQTKKYS
ncbi:hypothetical protein AS594_39265 [Streptomyces agglomeratus]|uniref:Uncharacterized protein n=1 Tax=Streptomyces agglomeratus TaxID=285458 RepID=A0A1E5NZ80_9ACTN|nr:hypothetical protein [Streptomyces agglomeratus]OEJ21574.1 hypothetical protein AS594_39265 [Streptomyces agglomeratus]